MPKFSYQVITESGSTSSGILEADTLEAANTKLTARGYIPTAVKEVPSSVPGLELGAMKDLLTPVAVKDIILFTKQFRTMIRAGISMLTLLQILEEQSENAKLRKILATMQQDINEGAGLYEAFHKHRRVFSDLYCSMVRAGETSGALPEILSRLTYILEHDQKVKSDIRSALQYPTLVVVFLIVAFVILLTFVVPKFVTIFNKAGLELPLPTVICMRLYEFVAQYYLPIGISVVLGVIALVFYCKTPQGQLVRDALILRIPIIGPLLLKSAISRFASTFSILYASGVSILDSMDIMAGTIGNQAIANELNQTRARLEEGRGISGPLRGSRYFTPMLINMIAIGEETGNLHEMLQEVANHYDSEVDYAMGRLSEAIGPVLTICLAAVVGFFALAIFLPMWDLSTMVR